MTQQKIRTYGGFDLLSLPIVGRWLKWRWGRLSLQIPFFIIAILVMYDGFTGPQIAPQNLATVAPWVHYRGIIVIALLLVGNLFCMGCPFTVPRTLAKRLALRGRRFPRFLRNKWVAIISLFILFFLYEWLDLWASPVLTAWVILFYFIASFVMEAFFTESAFCKYVCPLGTFNFTYSTASPTQISVKDPDICASCIGKECVNGSYNTETVIRLDAIPIGNGQTEDREVIHSPKGILGCGTELFAPQIQSNLECTLCLDCVRACPHDNASLFARIPGRELLNQTWMQRWDVSLLAILLTYFGLVNAFGMVPPVFDLQVDIIDMFGFTSEFPVLLLIFFIGSFVIPIALVLFTAQQLRFFTRLGAKQSLREIVSIYAPAFIPLGFGIWIAHYSFHFLIAPLAIIPVIQEFLGQTGQWELYTTPVDIELIGLIQVVALLGGFLWSMVIAQRSSLRVYRRESMIALMPWALLLLVTMLFAIQLFALPMEMRGTEFLFS